MATMCMTIRLVPISDGEGRLRELGEADRARSLGWRFEGRSWLGRHDARLSLHACDLLAADADWEAPTWSMSLAAAEQLAKSLDVLLAGVGADVIVEALWEGETPTEEQSISRTEFAGLVRGGLLGDPDTLRSPWRGTDDYARACIAAYELRD